MIAADLGAARLGHDIGFAIGRRGHRRDLRPTSPAYAAATLAAVDADSEGVLAFGDAGPMPDATPPRAPERLRLSGSS